MLKSRLSRVSWPLLKYRRIKNDLKLFIQNQSDLNIGENLFPKLVEALAIISSKSFEWNATRRLILLADLIHMQVNRMFKTMQRQHEALICHCLFKYCREHNARQKDI
ncbi:lantibiotic dehydratase C-terminal domain-containing protein [Mucilaginibacter endophyticus]|uniref:lantibiotic dehydratase C-terminal domain-containing protein n=1 Tax=Mucilaginibacter endophyticus TaxID=2675003 RepID=UPI003CC62643